MKVLAHIREQYSLSLGSYGRPKMTMELKEVGLDLGGRRVGRLMKINGISTLGYGDRASIFERLPRAEFGACGASPAWGSTKTPVNRYKCRLGEVRERLNWGGLANRTRSSLGPRRNNPTSGGGVSVASRRSGSVSNRRFNATSISNRDSTAPRQKCLPPPNAR